MTIRDVLKINDNEFKLLTCPCKKCMHDTDTIFNMQRKPT